MIAAYYYASIFWLVVWGVLAVWWEKDYGLNILCIVWAVVTVNLIVRHGGIG